MKHAQHFWSTVRKRALLIIASVLTLGFYLYRLSSLPTGALSAAEASSLQASRSLHAIITAPLFLPLNLLRYGLLRLAPSHVLLALRLPSVGIALLALAAMLYVVKRWYGQRTVLFAFVLLLSSAWFLHVGRLGSNDILYTAAVPVLLGANLLLYEYPENRLVLFLWGSVLAVSLYVPGLIWLALATVIWQRAELKESFSGLRVLGRFGFVLLCTLLVAPLVYGLVQHLALSYVLTWAGLPSVLPLWLTPFKNAAAAILFLVVRNPSDPSHWLGHLPVLDAFLTISFAAGIVFYLSHLRAARTKLLLLYGSISFLLCTASGGTMRGLLVPLVYLVAYGGIAYILHQWLTMFPRNPLARKLGIGLVCVAVGLSTVYGLRQYFIAWPHNHETQQTFAARP